MASIVDVNDLASLAVWQNRVRAALLVHALAITAKVPTNNTEDQLYQSARGIIQNSGNSAANVPLIIAIHVGGDYAATNNDITNAIEARKAEIYNVVVSQAVPRHSPMNQNFVQTVRRVVAKEAQQLAESVAATPQQRQFAATTLNNISQIALTIAQLAADNPKGEPLTDASTATDVTRAIRDAFKAVTPAATL